MTKEEVIKRFKFDYEMNSFNVITNNRRVTMDRVYNKLKCYEFAINIKDFNKKMRNEDLINFILICKDCFDNVIQKSAKLVHCNSLLATTDDSIDLVRLDNSVINIKNIKTRYATETLKFSLIDTICFVVEEVLEDTFIYYFTTHSGWRINGMDIVNDYRSINKIPKYIVEYLNDLQRSRKEIPL